MELISKLIANPSEGAFKTKWLLCIGFAFVESSFHVKGFVGSIPLKCLPIHKNQYFDHVSKSRDINAAPSTVVYSSYQKK